MKNVKELFNIYLTANAEEKEIAKQELIRRGVLTYDGVIRKEWEDKLLPLIIF